MSVEFNHTAFIGQRDFDQEIAEDEEDFEVIGDSDLLASEPAEIIVARVLFALLVSVSLVMNLLLALAVGRRWKTVHLIYILAASMALPDLIFYAKLVAELVNSYGHNIPSWATSNWACGLWQFSSHCPPIFYSSFLLAIVYHAFITLFLDYSGGYEDKAKRLYPVILFSIITLCTIISAPSGYFGHVKTKLHGKELSHFRQHCDLKVPSLMISNDKMTADMWTESQASYRLVYELILPFLMPIILLAFPYITLLIGLMRSVPAASHSEHSTKITVVVTLWLVTSFLMLHVPSILRNVFSVFNVWQRLVNMFNAHDDDRVPKFQTYIHILSYVCTCVWAIVRASLCFKYNHKLRKALGP